MLEQNHFLPKEYGTPLRKRHNIDQIDSEEDPEYSQGRSSITKTYSVPSTVDSPDLRPNSPNVFFELDLSQVLLEEEETLERCSAFHERGVCDRGSECLSVHGEGLVSLRRYKYEMISNFPELVIETPRRVRSFLE